MSQHRHEMGTLARQAVMTLAGGNDCSCGLWVWMLRTAVNSIFYRKTGTKGKDPVEKLGLVLLGNQRDLSVNSVGKYTLSSVKIGSSFLVRETKECAQIYLWLPGTYTRLFNKKV